MLNETLKVKGMSCNHCVSTIEGSVSKLEGVSQVNVNLDEGHVYIEFDEGQVTLDQIISEIDDQGYDVV